MSRSTRRLIEHGLLLLVGVILCAALYYSVPSNDSLFRWSMGTAYTALIFLGVTLSIGPINALRGVRTSVSSDLRRDVGIWCFFWSVLHTIFGLQVHMRGKMSEYFFFPGDGQWLTRIRTDIFGAANISGAVAVGVVVVLCALSNDLSLRLLGSHRWKKLQQANYLLFGIVVIHGVLYQIIEKRIPPYVFLLGVLVTGAVVLQVARALKRSLAKNN